MRRLSKRWGGLLGVWDTADRCSFLQVFGTNVVVFRQRLAGGGKKLMEGAGKLGETGGAFGGGG